MGRAAADRRGGLILDDHLRRWRLVQDGEVIVTPSSRLLPVRRDGEPAMLKIAQEPEERFRAGFRLCRSFRRLAYRRRRDGGARSRDRGGWRSLRAVKPRFQRTRLTLTMVPSGNSPDS
jgi:Aminoglycoside/hydroxyurea antibiotic resistance kinase